MCKSGRWTSCGPDLNMKLHIMPTRQGQCDVPTAPTVETHTHTHTHTHTQACTCGDRHCQGKSRGVETERSRAFSSHVVLVKPQHPLLSHFDNGTLFSKHLCQLHFPAFPIQTTSHFHQASNRAVDTAGQSGSDFDMRCLLFHTLTP
jgi:hypothetical protein